MNLTPKDKFLQSPEAEAHADLMANDSFQHALTVALAQMAMDLPGAETPATSWDSHCKMQGAKHFIHTLLNLGTKQAPRKTPGTPNLVMPTIE